MRDAPRTTVVVPCYNESSRLDRGQVRQLAEPEHLRVLLVNDGSTDDTSYVLAEIASAHPRIEVLELPENRGKAEAVRAGLVRAQADASWVGYLDADFATPAREMLRLIGIAHPSSADIVMGARIARLGARIARHPARHYLGRVFATAASLTLGKAVYDTQCGAKVFRVTPALERALEIPFRSAWAFDVELLSRLFDGGAEALEVPLEEWADVGGSKLRPTAMARAAFSLLGIARDRRRR